MVWGEEFEDEVIADELADQSKRVRFVLEERKGLL